MAEESSKHQRRSPKQARSRATWEAIVEAAAQILERRGPGGFNTSAVAERAGVSIGTLYQYFPDKRAILLAAAEREAGREAGRAEPGFVARQKALLRALVAMLESLGGGAATADAGRTTARTGATVRAAKTAPSERLIWAGWLVPLTLCGV